jgi:hypothetical protein
VSSFIVFTIHIPHGIRDSSRGKKLSCWKQWVYVMNGEENSALGEKDWEGCLALQFLKTSLSKTLSRVSRRRESPLHVKRRNEEAPGAASGRHPYGLGRRGPGELRGTVVPPQTSLGQSSIAPWTDWPPPGKKRETEY